MFFRPQPEITHQRRINRAVQIIGLQDKNCVALHQDPQPAENKTHPSQIDIVTGLAGIAGIKRVPPVVLRHVWRRCHGEIHFRETISSHAARIAMMQVLPVRQLSRHPLMATAVELDAVGNALHLLCHEQGRAKAGKRVENPVAGFRKGREEVPHQ